MRYGEHAEAVSKTWDCLERYDAVAVLVYHRDKKAFIVVRQFRPPVFRAERARRAAASKTAKPVPDPPSETGMTYELVAGLHQDLGMTAAETASAELLEEVGLRVSHERLEHVSSQVYGVGSAGMVLEVFFAEVGKGDEDPAAGGGLIAEGEWTEPVLVPLGDVPELLSHPGIRLPGGLMWALQYGYTRLVPAVALPPKPVAALSTIETFAAAAVSAAAGAVLGIWIASLLRRS
jgi:UDP-sugar diphosphatase